MKTRGEAPPVVVVRTLADQPAAYSLLQNERSGFVLATKAIPLPEGTTFIRLEKRSAVPRLSCANHCEKHGIPLRKRPLM